MFTALQLRIYFLQPTTYKLKFTLQPRIYCPTSYRLLPYDLKYLLPSNLEFTTLQLCTYNSTTYHLLPYKRPTVL